MCEKFKKAATYYPSTHKLDMLTGPDLFRLNKTVNKKCLTNLMMLLTDDDYATYSIKDLSSNEDSLTIIKGNIPTVVKLQANSANFNINNILVDG